MTVLPHKLTVVTEHSIPVKLLPEHRMPSLYSQSVTPVTVVTWPEQQDVMKGTRGGDFNAGVENELLVAVGLFRGAACYNALCKRRKH